jgi:hypothetical protein
VLVRKFREDVDFPKGLDRAPPSPSALNTMSASTPRLSELPTEILEHVLQHLPDRDIIKIEAVRTLLQSPCGGV